MHFFPTALSASYWVNSSERDEDERLIGGYLRPGDVMIDVGANIGALTLAGAAAVGRSGRIYSFEAHPRIFRYLEKNVKLNQFEHVEIFNAAVGAAPGTASLADIRSDDQNAIVQDSSLKVKVDTLDRLLSSKAPKIALMKVDVEGFEKYVFEGAEDILRKTEAVYFEAWERHFNKYHYSTPDVLGLLRGKGFHLFMFSENRLTDIAPDFIANECRNLLAVRDIAHFKSRLGVDQ